VTVATGAGVTVTVAVPDFPSLVALMVAVPGATPLTRPLAETVAMDELLELHETVRSVSVTPFGSFTVALNVVVVMPATILALDGSTTTLPTATPTTVTDALPPFPSLLAVIVAEPSATPVTTPVWETVAISGLLDVQLIVRPVSSAPLASRMVALSVVV